MKLYNKSDYFLKKFKLTQSDGFYIFSYLPITKAEVDNNLRRSLALKNIKRLILPSSFKVFKDKKVQGPRIGIFYSYNLNFKKLPYVYNVQATSFTLKDKWYVYNLLLDLKPYKTPLSLTISVCTLFTNNVLKFTKSINLSI